MTDRIRTTSLLLVLALSLTGCTGKKHTFEPPADTTTEAAEEEATESLASLTPQMTADNTLSDEKKGWYFVRNKEHEPPAAQEEIEIEIYDAYYLGDTAEKEVYLTFDEGYENGYTEQILDVLKEYEVPAAFFVTQTYIRDAEEVVLRMVEEGHIVGNHTVTHPSMPDISDDQIAYELEETARYFEEVTGTPMPRFMRPPQGEYSERTLKTTQDLGYKTIFWSYAYVDFEPENEPGKAKALQVAEENYHNGAIILLHAISKSNADAMAEMIEMYQELGYTFKSLDDLP